MSVHDPLLQDEVLATLAHLWPAAHREAIERLTIIEAYLQLRGDGIEEPEVRASARSAAHQLADTLGMFGFPHASELARRIDFALTDIPSSQELAPLLAHVAELRISLDAATP